MDKSTDERLEKLEKFQQDYETEQLVDREVDMKTKARCATAWSSILGFIGVVGAIIAFYSETVKAASVAAVKVIIERFQ